MGTALSISSIKIVAMVVREMNFMRRNLGQIIVASSILEDTTGWVIVSITLGIAGAELRSKWGALAKTVLGTGDLPGPRLYASAGGWVFWLIRWVNDTFVSEFAVITAILIVMCGLALITQGLGVNTVLGAFVAGVLVGESPILSQHIEDQLRGFITAFMMPVFFGLLGIFSRSDDPQGSDTCAAHCRARCRDRQRQKSSAAPSSGGRLERIDAVRVPRRRLRHECARQHGSHRRHHRPDDGRAHAEPLHHDRNHGGDHDHGDAADAALGPATPSHQRRRKGRLEKGRDRRQGLRQPVRAFACRRR